MALGRSFSRDSQLFRFLRYGTVLAKRKPVPICTYTLRVQFRAVLYSWHEVASRYVDKDRGQTFSPGEYHTVRGTHEMKGKRTNIVAYLTP